MKKAFLAGVFLLGGVGAAMPVGAFVGGGIDLGGVLDFNCDSTTRRCTCRGSTDCKNMADKGVCDGDIGCIGSMTTCSCKWKRPLSPRKYLD